MECPYNRKLKLSFPFLIDYNPSSQVETAIWQLKKETSQHIWFGRSVTVIWPLKKKPWEHILIW
jgi:hypothetical protein